MQDKVTSQIRTPWKETHLRSADLSSRAAARGSAESPGHWGGCCRAGGLAGPGVGGRSLGRRLGRVARCLGRLVSGDSRPPRRSAGRSPQGVVGGAAAGGVRLGEWEELGACESAIVG